MDQHAFWETVEPGESNPSEPAQTRVSSRILNADDDQSFSECLRDLLECRSDVEICAAVSTIPDAIHQARRWRPDIAIIGYRFPELGEDLIRALKCELPGLQIIVHTRDATVLSQVLEAGARAVVLKGEPTQHIVMAIEELAKGLPYFSPEVLETLLAKVLNHGNPGGDRLTRCERGVVQLVAEGNTSREIARTLGIAVKTVETHRISLMRKLKLRNLPDIVRYAIRENFILA